MTTLKDKILSWDKRMVSKIQSVPYLMPMFFGLGWAGGLALLLVLVPVACVTLFGMSSFDFAIARLMETANGNCSLSSFFTEATDLCALKINAQVEASRLMSDAVRILKESDIAR
ncbi:hypothetical protein ACFOY8_14740 [Thalassospira xianhensis]|uniref:Uncharacterized protein n=1 Tax=Thalassospira xianhensis MCCC 1A02616 TaxID=1177929 RepID=A0A367UKE5_9PROT|nr:hypothetical protein [Thalassospira xianhensis]RCK07592.1 hypothetical protein TH5_00490 [Thalassospira xianhensis MCCC 1A02616]